MGSQICHFLQRSYCYEKTGECMFHPFTSLQLIRLHFRKRLILVTLTVADHSFALLYLQSEDSDNESVDSLDILR